MQRAADGEPDGQVTLLLEAWRRGDRRAAEPLLEMVYEQLRAMARSALRRERSPSTLQATALVHELFLRFDGGTMPAWRSRGHFFAIAARVMRRILVEAARRRGRLKRGGVRQRVEIGDAMLRTAATAPEVLAVDQALDRLEAQEPELAQLVELRFFVGLSVAETARALGCSTATVGRRWRHAKACLYRELDRTDEPGGRKTTHERRTAATPRTTAGARPGGADG